MAGRTDLADREVSADLADPEDRRDRVARWMADRAGVTGRATTDPATTDRRARRTGSGHRAARNDHPDRLIGHSDRPIGRSGPLSSRERITRAGIGRGSIARVSTARPTVGSRHAPKVVPTLVGRKVAAPIDRTAPSHAPARPSVAGATARRPTDLPSIVRRSTARPSPLAVCRGARRPPRSSG